LKISALNFQLIQMKITHEHPVWQDQGLLPRAEIRSTAMGKCILCTDSDLSVL